MKSTILIPVFLLASCATQEQTDRAIDLGVQVLTFSLAAQKAPTPEPVPSK